MTIAAETVGVFYAYIHNRSDDNTWRMTIIFASRDVADEWWRAVSTSDITKLKNNIQRITSQFYNHDANQWNFYNFFIDSDVKPVANLFRGKMFLVLENDRGGRGISIIPPQYIVDLTSGTSYYIRSKANPQQYWDVDENGHVYVSDKSRTSFVVTALNNLSKGTILIGSDEVKLSTARGAVTLQKTSVDFNFSFVTTSTCDEGHHFKLSDLKEGRLFVRRNLSLFELAYLPRQDLLYAQRMYT